MRRHPGTRRVLDPSMVFEYSTMQLIASIRSYARYHLGTIPLNVKQSYRSQGALTTKRTQIRYSRQHYWNEGQRRKPPARLFSIRVHKLQLIDYDPGQRSRSDRT